MAKKKTMVLGTSAAALALVAGLGFAGVASAANSSPTASDSSTGTTKTVPAENGWHGGHGGRGDHKGGGQEMASSLAEKLGVDQAKVNAALDTFRNANKPTERTKGEAKPERSQMDAVLAKSLAGSLGIDESKVTKALEEIRSAAQTARASGLKSKLDAAVTYGKLTQAEADAVTKAIELGVIGGR